MTFQFGKQQHSTKLVPCFKASVTNGTLEMLVYSDIGATYDGTGTTAKDIKAQIDAAGMYNKIVLRINSPGGDAFEGIAIHNLLRSQGKPIEVCIDGLAASSASIVAMCGDQITIGHNAMIMVHNAWSVAIGNASELRKQADTLDKVSGSIAQTFVDRTGNSMKDVQAMMDAETWLTADDCMKLGFVDTIAEQPDEPAAIALARSFKTLQNYKGLPDHLKANTAKTDATDGCMCECKDCPNDCPNCSNVECKDPNCFDCPNQTSNKTTDSNVSQYEARLALLRHASK